MGLTTFLNDSRPPQRGLLWLSLAETGRVLRREEKSDEGGGWTETYSPAGTADWKTSENVPCRIDALMSGSQTQAGGRVSDLSTHTITLPAGTEVTVDDDFQIKDHGRFEITAVRRYTQEFARVIEVTDQTT